MTRDELINYYAQLFEKYPLILLEDGCAQDDWEGFQKLMAKMNGKHVQIVG
jgi:enolase